MDLECNYLIFCWLHGKTYTCEVNSVITEPGNIKSLIGSHLPGKTNDDVEAIAFFNHTVHYIPKGIEKFFPKLKHLEIYGCNLKWICRLDICKLRHLERISITENYLLTSLPTDLLVDMPKLRWIDFNNNLNLRFVSSKILEPVKNNALEKVSFHGSTIIRDEYKKSNDKPLKDLMDSIDRLGFPRLATMCSESVLKNLDKSNKTSQVLAVYNLGHSYKCKEMKRSAFKVIRTRVPGLADRHINCVQVVNDMVMALT